MLPARLSSDLCSLKGICGLVEFSFLISRQENETRFAFSALITVDSMGNVVHVEFARTVIRSRKAFTYAEAQDYLQRAREKDTKDVSLYKDPKDEVVMCVV
jgi:exoribonuclease R